MPSDPCHPRAVAQGHLTPGRLRNATGDQTRSEPPLWDASPAGQSVVIVTPEWLLWSWRMCDRRHSGDSRMRTRVGALRHHTARWDGFALGLMRGEYAAGNAQAGSKWADGLSEVRPYSPGVAGGGTGAGARAGIHEVLDCFRAPADAVLVGAPACRLPAGDAGHDRTAGHAAA